LAKEVDFFQQSILIFSVPAFHPICNP